MIDYDKYITTVTTQSLETLGVYGAIANRLIYDLDAGDISEQEANDFIILFQVNESVDLVEYM